MRTVKFRPLYFIAFLVLTIIALYWLNEGRVDNTVSLQEREELSSTRLIEYFKGNHSKYVTFQTIGNSGWGNGAMSIMVALRYAIATNRTLVIDYFKFHRVFEYPIEGMSWSQTLPSGSTIGADFSPRLSKMNISDYDYSSYEIVSTQANIFGNGEGKFLNDLVEQHIIQARKNWFEMAATTSSFLLSRPTKEIRGIVDEIKVNFTDLPVVTIQLRSFKDYDPGHEYFMQPERQELMWNCISESLGKFITPNSHNLFFTTDEPSLRPVAQQKLEKYGKVLFNDVDFIHSSGNGFMIPIAEWMILSESDVIICTATSFCQSAIERNGNKAKVVFVFGVHSHDPNRPVTCGTMEEFYKE